MSVKQDLENQIAYCNSKLAEKGINKRAIGVKGVGDLIETIESGITPTGTTEITENGTFDVTNFASALVDVSGGGLPLNIDKIDSGTYTPSVDTITPPIVQHKLGVVPDVVLIYTNELDKCYSTDAKQLGTVFNLILVNVPQRTSSTTYGNGSFYYAFPVLINDVTCLYSLSVMSTTSGRVLPTEDNISFIKISTQNYPYKGNVTYHWVAIKFKEGVTI